MTDRTPGPWTVETHPTKYPDLFTYNVIAPRGWQEPDGSYVVCGVACELDSEPDARLIAAAPTLLEALVHFERVYPYQWDGDRTGFAVALNEVHIAARAAIAQARGEQVAQ